MKPEDIHCIDPCCGSGHILAYLFDVLVQIYEDYGYTTREAVSSIVENNIYGLDLDDRAAQLANFAVMMKARRYDRRFFSRGIQPHVYSIVESNHIDTYLVDYFSNGDINLKKAIETIIDELHDAKEYGSILSVTQQDWNALYGRFAEINEDVNMFNDAVLELLAPLVNVAKTLADKYDIVVTNPPYMGINNMGGRFYKYITGEFEAYKHDLYCVFINVCHRMLRNNRFQAMITQQSFMFNSRYEKARISINLENTCVSLLHLGARAFEEIGGEVVQAATFVLFSNTSQKYMGIFIDLQDGDSQQEKENEFLKSFWVGFQKKYTNNLRKFEDISGCNYSYWLSKQILSKLLSSKKITNYAEPRHGLVTGNGDLFMRLWSEVNSSKICFDGKRRGVKWYPYNKGGTMRRWYGNREYVINWQNDGFDVRNYSDSNGKIKSSNYNMEYIFKSNITWSDLTTGLFSARYTSEGALFDTSGPSLFLHDKANLKYLIGFMNTKVMQLFLNIYCTGLHYSSGSVGNMPLILCIAKKSKIESLAEKCIMISEMDWNALENSWNFKCHPLICTASTIVEAFSKWSAECSARFNQLKANEEELNRIFIDIYGLQSELTPGVEDRDVTVLKADLQRDIKSLLSYAVGCMFGRYSLDIEGLVYAGGEWDASKYQKFPADEDNIIPICDDEYFEDDIVDRLIEFVKVVYGERSLEENLQFIADALGGKGSSREVIRNYFRNDFFKDHCKIYQKRPIYWLFDSGKKGGFKALIYMHRYQPDTIARMRTDYVHEQQARYRTAIEGYEQRAASASGAERVTLNKKLKTLREEAEELHGYEEKIHHLADQMISIDLDDGVKHNYAIFQDVLAKIK